MSKKQFLIGVAALAAVLGGTTAAQAARAYIGTYTQEPAARGDNHGEGIYLVDIDDATGAPSNPRLAAKMQSPAWMVFSPDHRFLYANSEIGDFGPDKTGSVTAFAVNAASGALTPLNTVSSGSAGPAYIDADPSGKFVLVANYSGGSFVVIRLKSDGSLGEITDQVKPGGPLSSPTASDTQPGQFAGSDHSGTHGHMIGTDPSGRYVIGDDAGRDQIFVWKLDQGTGKLQHLSVTKSLPGSAPRHFVFSPDSKVMYQLQEQDSRLQAYDFKDGMLTARGPSIFTPPDGYEGSNTTSELLIDKAGTHLYVANRTQNSIATITTGAAVKRTANTPTEGDTPRSLALDPSGKFLYSLNQRANNVVTFRIGAGGVPKATGKFLALGSPAVMVFLSK
jgi:6-phosphogluconolactonase (cycloisomerase 2 family)